MKNLCENCIFAQWDLESVENARCEQNPALKIIDESNCVNECSCYKSKNIITCIINFIKKQ